MVRDWILYEDEVILVINKPAGLMVEPDRNNNPSLLWYVKDYLKKALPPDAAVYAQHIHRIDRPVSGIVLFAKKREVLKNLSEQFAERRVKKFYKALTEQAPLRSPGRLEHWHRKEKKKAALYETEIEYSEKAMLAYSVVQLAENKFRWDIELHTGKFHQIRAQLASVGCPIMGDATYGSTYRYKENTIGLQAYKLEFLHPVSGKKMTVEVQQDF